MSTEKENSKAAATSKTAAHHGKQGKALEAPVHHASSQRRTVAVDEEKKEREMRAARARHHGAHGGHGVHGGHGADMGQEEHH
ncbi:MAG TPA: hypothetical protein VFE32_15260 [Puia sp.]|jgi:hypothetical protein|nr:hypothetical protein [Puia sp.]